MYKNIILHNIDNKFEGMVYGHNIIREKAFREMKKDVGMTTAQKSKETRRMEMGSIFILYIPTYMYITAL